MQTGLTRTFLVHVGLLLGAVSLVCFVPSHGFRFEPLAIQDMIRTAERTSDSLQRVAALRGLGSMLPRHCKEPAIVAAATKAIVPHLESPVWPVRHEAVYAMHPLCVCSKVPCPPALIERLEDSNQTVKEAAASWLGDITTFPPGTEEIARRCVASDNSDVLMVTPHLLRRTLGATDEVRHLLEFLSRNDNPNVRHNAEIALWQLFSELPRAVAFSLTTIDRYWAPDVWKLPFQERDPFQVRAASSVMLLEQAAARFPDDTATALLLEIADPHSPRHFAAKMFLNGDKRPEQRRPLLEAMVTQGTAVAIRELSRGNTAGAASVAETVLLAGHRLRTAEEETSPETLPTEPRD